MGTPVSPPTTRDSLIQRVHNRDYIREIGEPNGGVGTVRRVTSMVLMENGGGLLTPGV
ncbi:hypothetical protein HanPSC8_Chr04g0177071 [Helianthus annuus]|nr:hypothetical protein HanPSC8_Chr04g0177071 [Helianthus annuus]